MTNPGQSVSHPGLSRYHHLGLLVPLTFAISPMFFARIFNPQWPQAVNALMAGIISACLAYVLMAYVPGLKEEHPLPRAVMLGLLTAEFTVFTRSYKIPSVVNILFYLFMYFIAFTEFRTDIKHSF